MLHIFSMINSIDEVPMLAKSEDSRGKGTFDGTLNTIVLGNCMEAPEKISKPAKFIS